MKTCLFVLDAQQSFQHREYFDASKLPQYLQRQNQLINHCITHNIPIVRIFHTTDTGAFSLASGHVIPLEGLTDFDATLCVYKSRHSALVDTKLPTWLISNNIEHIIISGIRTEQCCETTTRHASDMGYKVTYVLDATLTFDMINKDGSVFSAEQIKQRTQTVLQDRFANVINTQDVIVKPV